MKAFRERNPIKVGLVGAAVLLVVGLTALSWEKLPFIGGTTYTAEFTEAAGLKPDNEVRVGGVKVGKVTDVELAGDHVVVSFRVKDAWLGDRTTAAIKIKTLLGQKTLALEPEGVKELDPDKPIPRDRTSTPYDVNDAFSDLAKTTGEIDTQLLASAFRTLSQTFDSTTPEEVKSALRGLSAFSKTISSRDEKLRQLLSNTHQISKTMAGQSDNVAALLTDGRTLLEAIGKRRDAIAKLLSGSRALAKQLSGLVTDNQKQIGPALAQLERVNKVLVRNQQHLNESLRLAGPFYRLIGGAVNNGRWVDNYVCGLVDRSSNGCVPPKPGGR
jgi:phospholipid/cholesterol/gamma-HCH transport system substrate-binding protein